jgi:hypothetical protein
MGITSSRFQYAALIAAIVGLAVVLFIFEPGRSGIYAPCLLHKLTGLYCPGCGSMRGLHQLLHGHILAAIKFNPLMILLLPFIVYALVSHRLNATRVWAPPEIFARPVFVWLLVAVIIAFGVLRNVPVYPFTVLAP